MRKIKLLTTFGFIALLLFAAKPAYAVVPPISITQLPSYITTNSFKLSYSCLGCTSVQFYVNKNGGGWVAFGPAMTDAGGQVQVTSSEVNDQTDYMFKVSDSGVGEATTSTFYDISGPSPVSSYYKERINDGLYKLHFHTPSDSDFGKVVIYRGDVAGFSADSGHEIARVNGGANSDMSYDDSFAPDAGKTYYYAIRALDQAGNSSSLVGDAGTVQGATTVTQAQAPEGKVVFVPEEEGQVLPESTGEPVTTEETPPGELEGKTAEAAASPWVRWAIGIIIGIVALWLLVSLRKRD